MGNRCVLMSDHHCGYLANCIGSRNYRTYISVLLALLLPCLHRGSVCLLALSRTRMSVTSWRSQWMTLLLLLSQIAGAAVPSNLLCTHLWLISKNLTTREWNRLQDSSQE